MLKHFCLFRFICHRVSILTAIFFLATLINSAINTMWISLVIAAFFLLLWEVVKGVVLQNINDTYYQTNTLPYQLIIVAVVCPAGSVYSSIRGAEKYYQKKSKFVSNVDNTFKLQKDSIVSYYTNQLNIVEGQYDKYVETAGGKGRFASG